MVTWVLYCHVDIVRFSGGGSPGLSLGGASGRTAYGCTSKSAIR